MKKGLMIKVLFELIKNSKRSDRELARSLSLWPSTITRYRKRLEKEAVIQEYTAIPDLSKMGYEILAFLFVRMHANARKEWSQKMREKLYDFAEVIFATRVQGMGQNVLIISLHKSYSQFHEYHSKFVEFGKDLFEDTNTVMTSLSEDVLKPFSLKYLEKKRSFY